MLRGERFQSGTRGERTRLWRAQQTRVQMNERVGDSRGGWQCASIFDYGPWVKVDTYRT